MLISADTGSYKKDFRSYFFLVILLFGSFISRSQTIILNEVSQGETGGMEYVEFVVVDSTVTYNCADTEPPCIDIRGWIIDDNSGYHGGAGIAAGACRFSFDPLWSCVPVGTIILIYNDGDPNNQLPADDVSLSDGNCAIVAPISSSLFETNTTTPGAIACSYPATGWTVGGNWTNIVMANGGDCFRIVDLSGCEVFSLCWDDNNQNNMVYFPGGATSATSATNTVYYFNNGDPTSTLNWTIGCADPPACGQQDQTPGAPNNALNESYIAQFNNGCTPIPPIEVLANVVQNSSCICDGQASASATGSIPGYTFEWFDDSFNPIGQTTATVTGLCGGTYYVIGTSSIDCSDTAMVTITASGGGILGLQPPPVLSFQCISDISPAYTLFSEFLGDGGVLNGNITNVDTTSFVLISQSTDGNTCPETITRTYEITDSCGVLHTVDQIIVVNDNIAPVGTAPAPVTVQCLADVPAVNIADVTGVSDNCTATPTVTHVGDVSDGNTCPEVITRTYQIEDDCGNVTTLTQTITIDDDIAPLGTAPAPVTVQCIGDVPAVNIADVTGVSDNCTAAPLVTHVSDVSDGNTCPEVITRTYQIEDDCGNITTLTQTITVDDDIAPVATAPAPVTVQCAGDVPPVNIADVTGVSDNCTAAPLVTHVSDVSDGNACPEVITRTYQVEDDCGNTTTVAQTITVDDTQDPTASNPAPISAAGSAPTPDVTVVDDEADNCTANPVVAFVGDVTDGNTCPETITRTYSVTDDCGNQIFVEQTITIGDAVIPTASNPDPINVQCAADVPAPDPLVVDDEADNGAPPVVTWEDDTSDGNTCPEVITRRYRVTDDCGNFIFVEQTITINDDIAPTASNPATTTVQCATDVPAVDVTVVTDEADNCTVNPTVTFISETSDGNVCNGEEITRTYEIADDCGNTTTVTHTIIIDSYTPTFTVAGTDPTTCGGTDGFIVVSGLDPNTAYEIGYNGNAPQSVNSDANGEYIITGLGAGSYTNFSVAPSSCTLCEATDGTVINLVDPNAPAINAVPDQEVCEGTDVTLTADNPDGANISWDNGVTDGAPFTPGVGTISYTVTAEIAGCISTDVATITVNPLPNVNAGNDVVVCEGDLVVLTATGAHSYAWNNGVINGVEFVPQTTDVYEVIGTTLAGCSDSDQVEVEVNEEPTVLFSADITEGCVPLTVNFTSETIGNNSDCIYILSDGTVLNDCNPSHTFTAPGCYDVTLQITTANGCFSTQTIEDYICVSPYPEADFNVNPEILTSLNNIAQFNNLSTGAESYYWDFGDGSSSSLNNPSHEFSTNEDSYEVELIAYNEYGCADTAIRVLPLREELVFYVPNTFTPDNDDYNEVFKPVFTSGFDPYNYQLLIFNRWGEVIFESNNAEIGWNGTYGVDREELVKDGTYVWKITFKTKYKDERVVKVGHVNVLK